MKVLILLPLVSLVEDYRELLFLGDNVGPGIWDLRSNYSCVLSDVVIINLKITQEIWLYTLVKFVMFNVLGVAST